jgi:2-keto-3-deoxygluconate permease
MNISLMIKKSFAAIPGSMMSIPLVAAMLINTFLPDILLIGNLTTALFQDGALTLLGLLLFLVGTQFQVSVINSTWRSGLILLMYKLSIGTAFAMIIFYGYGPVGIIGITPVVALIALTQPNLAMYVAITKQFGRTSQYSMLPLFVFMETPLVTMLVLDINGMIQSSLVDYLAMMIPFLSGILVGLILGEKKQTVSALIPIVIPFFAFSAGAQFELSAFVESGISGLILSVAVLGSGVIAFFLLYLLSPDDTNAGIALGATAGTSLFIPPLLASMDESFVPLVPSMTAQLVTITVITCIFCPMAAKYLKKYKR